MDMDLNIDELLQIAENIEREGKAFYTSAASLTNCAKTKKLFLDLAQWEEKHMERFSKFRSTDGRNLQAAKIIDPCDEEGLYLKAAVEGKIFKKVASPKHLVSKCGGDISCVVSYAIEREKDSIVFYTALSKKISDEDALDTIDKIIGEEISHVRFLSVLLHDMDLLKG